MPRVRRIRQEGPRTARFLYKIDLAGTGTSGVRGAVRARGDIDRRRQVDTLATQAQLNARLIRVVGDRRRRRLEHPERRRPRAGSNPIH